MTFEEAVREEARKILEGEWKRAGKALKVFPKGPMGLTPDEVKVSPEFRAAKSAYDKAFEALRRFNAANPRGRK